MNKTLTFRCGLILALLALPLAGKAQDYPTRPVRFVVPYPAGSSPDMLARLIGEHLGRRIKQTVIIDNKAGAAGMIGARSIADSPADGNTLLMYTPAWPAQKIFVKKPLLPVPEGLKPVTLVATGRLALVAAQALPATNFSEMVGYAKAHPGKLNYATTGPGDVLLDFEILKRATGIKVEHIQYKGAALIITALVANEVQLGLQAEATTEAFVKEGKLKVFGVTGETRSAVYPDAPTFNELGLPKIRSNWMGIFVHSGTHGDTVSRLNADLVAVIKSAEVSKRMAAVHFEPVASTPEQLGQRVQSDIADWTAIAAAVGIQPE